MKRFPDTDPQSDSSALRCEHAPRGPHALREQDGSRDGRTCGSPRRLSALAAVLALVLAACVSMKAPPRQPFQLADADYPGELRAPSAYPADVLLRQRVTASWGDPAASDPRAHGERSFDCAFQKQGDTLTLLGLTPLGSAGFVLTLTGDRIAFENRTPESLPFPPRFVLLDVERVFFPWLAGSGAPLPDGEHAGDVGAEHVVEYWAGGRLVERRFTRLDGKPAGTITVRYAADAAHAADAANAAAPARSTDPAVRTGLLAPPRAELDNGWLGYRLTVETYEETPLPASAPR
jgi:Protein of unknown function (DUF3261)